jgi:hypothetical protein
MNERATTQERFDRFYRELYATRWDRLKEALLAPTEPTRYDEHLLHPYFLDEASESPRPCSRSRKETGYSTCARHPEAKASCWPASWRKRQPGLQ